MHNLRQNRSRDYNKVYKIDRPRVLRKLIYTQRWKWLCEKKIAEEILFNNKDYRFCLTLNIMPTINTYNCNLFQTSFSAQCSYSFFKIKIDGNHKSYSFKSENRTYTPDVSSRFWIAVIYRNIIRSFSCETKPLHIPSSIMAIYYENTDRWSVWHGEVRRDVSSHDSSAVCTLLYERQCNTQTKI